MPTRRSNSATRKSVKSQTNTYSSVRRTARVHSSRHSAHNNNYLQFIFSLDIKVIIAIVLIILLLFWLIIDSICFASKFYPGTKIEGVDVSGLTKTEAKEKLTSEFDRNLHSKTVYIFTNEDAFNQVNLEDYFNQQDRIAEQITSIEQASDTQIYQTNADEVGANYDYDKALESAIKPGHNLNIFTRLGMRLFGKNYDLNLETGDGLDALYSKVATATGEPHTDFGIKINDGEVSIAEGVDGKAINSEKFSTGLTNALTVKSGDPQKALFGIEDDPVKIGQSEAEQAKEKAEKIIEEGVTFSYSSLDLNITRSELGGWVTTWIDKTNDTALRVGFDDNKAKQGIAKALNDSSKFSQVSVLIDHDESGQVRINPTSEVLVPDLQMAVDKLKENKLAENRIDDVIEIQSSEQTGNFDFDTALQVGLITEISSYTTTFTNTSSTANRNHNIAKVSDAISGTIISKDSGEFSFNTVAGPCDAEHGYLDAGTQVGGQIVQEAGGGICQVATTVFNAVYDAGYDLTERHNHSLRNLGYPAGRDAAVYVSDNEYGHYELDLKWLNDSDSDVLLKSWHDDTSVTVALYGSSPNRTVESIAGDYEEGEKHSIIFTEDDSLASGQWTVKTVGTDGTQITVERKVYDKDKQLIHDNIFTSIYGKTDEEILVGPNVDKEKIRSSRS